MSATPATPATPAPPAPLPPNAHVSQHPCLRAKLSQLRSRATSAREAKALIHEIALIVGCEALAHGLHTRPDGTDTSPLGDPYTRTAIAPSHIALVPVLRSGLGMLDALQALLPHPVPTHHLGLYRDRATLQPVEYYNNLPYHRAANPAAASSSSSSSPPAAGPAPPHPPTGTGPGTGTGTSPSSTPCALAIVLDPIIATGATACAAIDTLRDWGARRIIVVSVLASAAGLRRAAGEWAAGVDVWVGGCDERVDADGMIRPGVGDVGDRLFLT